MALRAAELAGLQLLGGRGAGIALVQAIVRSQTPRAAACSSSMWIHGAT